MRKILIIAGLVLLVVGGFLAWRALHPPLSDAEQVQANLEDLANALEERSGRRVEAYLAPEFKWQGYDRETIRSQLSGFSVMSRDVEVHLASVRVNVQNESATSEGNFTLSFRPRPKADLETNVGRFKLYWEKREGNWVVVKAEGGENVQP